MTAATELRVDAQVAADILDVLARYAQVIDNRDWDHAHTVFTDDVVFGVGEWAQTGTAAIRQMVENIQPYHPHHTSNTVLTALPDGSVRGWSKFFIVRTDGTAGSGDYQDTFVETPAGWRIAHRVASRGNRRPDDPGGPSSRTFTFDSWRQPNH
ncbi:nuclear transport factor 2 family protein [Nocardia sp. 348MFTsu5.1]|uniref:nuclear transport factor 2 family protein n=1 Tax=Nocardia sp. 348MFTsu5.1 TaxID=1172185 RepID=UPI0003A3A70A|nr:nuclear transport factor 2 family protein [Nocardia sp. 348MFTsu5.1]